MSNTRSQEYSEYMGEPQERSHAADPYPSFDAAVSNNRQQGHLEALTGDGRVITLQWVGPRAFYFLDDKLFNVDPAQAAEMRFRWLKQNALPSNVTDHLGDRPF